MLNKTSLIRLGLVATSTTMIFLLAFVVLADSENREALQSGSGSLTDGGHFGVDVGMDISRVSAAVRTKGFRLYARGEPSSSCLWTDYPQDEAVDVYVDESWRKGTLCVGYNVVDRKVTRLEWSYAAFSVAL